MLTLKQHQSDQDDNNLKKEIHRSFLRQLIPLLNNITFEIPENQRGINDTVLKTFIKEVFVKHELQGINFNAWNYDDIMVLDVDYMPDALKQEIYDRQLSVIETNKFWYLVAPSHNFSTNRFSVCRFLEEDRSYGLYQTYGLCVPRKTLHNNEQMLAVVIKLLNTIYTLDTSASVGVIKFIEDSKKAKNNHITPLLRQKISHSGDLEESISKRLEEYEKQLTNLILARIPNAIENANSNNDRFILNHHLNKMLGELSWELELFTLLPVVCNSNAAHKMHKQFNSYRLLLDKSYDLLWQANMQWKERIEPLMQPITELNHIAEKIIDDAKYLEQLTYEWQGYQTKLEEGKLLAKLGFGKPKYDEEAIENSKNDLAEQCFVDIIRLTKKHHKTMVYFEFENPTSTINDGKYRHYALCYSKKAIDRLPFLVLLPEERQKFDVMNFYRSVKAIVEHKS